MNINVDNLQSLKKLNTNLKNKDFALWFYANWCGHCKDMESEWNNLEKDCKHKYNVARVRDDMKDKLVHNLGSIATGFPTIVTIRNGKVVATHNKERNSSELLK